MKIENQHDCNVSVRTDNSLDSRIHYATMPLSFHPEI